jgi:hypothetical protein
MTNDEKRLLVKGAAERIHNSLDEERRKKYPTELIERVIYRIPRLNLGPTRLKEGYSNGNEGDTQKLESQQDPEIRREMFIRVFMKSIDTLRGPRELRKFLDTFKNGDPNDK